jgi:aerobic-type carbon monoxide dehydrogenase small subunit (CoxS/CutS family)
VKQIITLNVNGDDHEVVVPPWRTLLDVLRDGLRLKGTKKACEEGACGVCTVIMDGKAILSCLKLAIECQGRTITTIEGISGANDLHPIQQSFVEHGAIQCGFCTPGIIMTSKALLDENPTPTDDEINEALAGTFCRCTGHVKIKEAVKDVKKA